MVLIGVIPNGEIDLTEALQNVFDHQDNPFFRFLATHYPGRAIVSYQDQQRPAIKAMFTTRIDVRPAIESS